jgi:predicted MPP superfamily phosphohydrolase
MRRLLAFALSICLTWALAGCTSTHVILHTDDEPFVMTVDDGSLDIIQLTDLHLTYGIDRRDRMTFDLISDLVDAEDWDLVVLTGDMMMSPSAVRLFKSLVRHMESLGTPWTFVFGNHDDDFHDKATLLDAMPATEHLLFKAGPAIEDGGAGNFEIRVGSQTGTFAHLYFLDSKSERDDNGPGALNYDYLSKAQVAWYETKVEDDTAPSVVFMHMPLQEYGDAVDYEGTFGEDKVYWQGINTGFFDAMVTHGKSLGVFVGHDHLNDFSFMKDGILLAYGRATGYNGYGSLERGGRTVRIDSEGRLTSSIITGEEIRS